MDKVQLFDRDLLAALHEAARGSERLRQNFDLRTTPEDGSQRMLNALEPGTRVPIHRHLHSSETVVCLEGCLEEVFFEELPNRAARCMTVNGRWWRVALPRWHGSGFAPVRGRSGCRSRRWCGTRSRCWSRA